MWARVLGLHTLTYTHIQEVQADTLVAEAIQISVEKNNTDLVILSTTNIKGSHI
jgi:hypothetical protein